MTYNIGVKRRHGIHTSQINCKPASSRRGGPDSHTRIRRSKWHGQGTAWARPGHGLGTAAINTGVHLVHVGMEACPVPHELGRHLFGIRVEVKELLGAAEKESLEIVDEVAD